MAELMGHKTIQMDDTVSQEPELEHQIRLRAYELYSGCRSIRCCMRYRGEGADAVASDIRASGGKALSLRMDVTERTACTDMISVAVREFGRVDILVNNAAIDLIEPVQDVRPENWARILDVNLTGVFHCSQAVNPSRILLRTVSFCLHRNQVVGAFDTAASHAEPQNDHRVV